MASYPGVTITRGEGNIPIIDAPDIPTGIEAAAYMNMYDRPVQTIGLIYGANGMLSQLIPSNDAYTTDIGSLAYLYTDEDVLRQYDLLTPNTRMLIEHTVIGINYRLQETPLPYPPVTKVNIFNLIYIMASQFTPKIFFQSHNSNIWQALLEMYDQATATNILNDIVGVNGETKASNPVVEGNGSIGGSGMDGCLACNIPLEEYYDDLTRAGKATGTHITMGSRSIMHRDNDISTGIGGAQAGQGVPSPIYISVLNTPEYKIDALAIPGSALGTLMPNIVYGDYAYTIATQTGSFHARDGTIVPESDTYVYRTVTIPLPGGGTQEYEVRRATKGGFVLPVTSGIPSGQVVVARTAFPDNAMVGISVMVEVLFLDSIDAFRSIPDMDYHTDVPLMVMTYMDSQGNVGAIHTGMTTSIGKDINRKLLTDGNWEYTSVHRPVVSINEMSIYRYWNGAWSTTQGTYHKNYYEYSKEHWIDHSIQLTGNSITYDNAPNILAMMGNSVVLGLHIEGSLPDLVNDTDAFTIISPYLRQVMSNTPDALDLIDRYDGTWVGKGTISDMVTAPRISEDWFLANTWLANIIKGIFRGIVPDIAIVDNYRMTGVGTDMLSLLIRILLNPMNNRIYYQGYPNEGQIGTIIQQAWVDTMATNMPSLDRPIFDFAPGTGISIPYHQHGTHESATEMSQIGILRRGHIIAPGEVGGVDTSLLEDFMYFRLLQLGPRLLPYQQGRVSTMGNDAITTGALSLVTGITPTVGSQTIHVGTNMIARIPITIDSMLIHIIGRASTYAYDATYVYNNGTATIMHINVTGQATVTIEVVDDYIWITSDVPGTHTTMVTII